MGISPELAIKIAADNIESLRRIDVFRVLDTYKDDAKAIGAFIRQHRPELSKEVFDCLEELGELGVLH